MTHKQFTCNECGSTDLEALALCTVNSHEFVDWSVAGDADECFCNDCDDWGTCSDNEVVQVECSKCFHEGWWGKDHIESAHCRQCDLDMQPMVEEMEAA